MVGTTGERRVDQKDVQAEKGLSCSILQVQDFPVKTKQQQEEPTKTCLTPSRCPTAFSPSSLPAVWMEGLYSLCPALIPAPPPLLNSPLPVIRYSLLHPQCHMPMADTSGPLQATQARNLNLVSHHSHLVMRAQMNLDHHHIPISPLLPLAPNYHVVSALYLGIWAYSLGPLATTHCPRS